MSRYTGQACGKLKNKKINWIDVCLDFVCLDVVFHCLEIQY